MGAKIPDPDTFTQDGAGQQAEGGASSGVEWAEPASVLAWIGSKQDWINCAEHLWVLSVTLGMTSASPFPLMA